MKFRLKIKDVINEYGMDPLILIPKNGGLKEIVSETLLDMGVNYLKFDKIDRDNYTDGNLKVSIYRGEDIPKIVEELYFDKRVKAIGFTGDDLYDEYRLRNPGTIVDLLETVDWYDENAKFKKPALCIITRKGEQLKGKIKAAINRKYELTSRIVIDEIKNDLEIEPEIRVYSGNLEQTVAEDINDMCIEIVYGGETLNRFNLEVKGKPVRLSDFVLIGVNEKSPKIFEREYAIIKDRVDNPRKDSYTSKLASNENNAMKKIGEETAEFINSLCKCNGEEGKQKLIGEFADMWFVMQLNLAMKGIEFGDITDEIYKRIKKD